jgi:hypothetical protein
MALNTFGEERRLLPVVRLGNRLTGGSKAVKYPASPQKWLPLLRRKSGGE